MRLNIIKIILCIILATILALPVISQGQWDYNRLRRLIDIDADSIDSAGTNYTILYDPVLDLWSAADIPLWTDVNSTFVPYTGATSNVTLGNHTITAQQGIFNGTGANEFGTSNFTGDVDIDGNVSANYYTGNGSLLTGIASGYTNLTQFTAQTPWRVFYSNATGQVIELALGADGTFLKSNGAAVAPTFATPAGSGDMTKAAYDVDADDKVDAIEEALMIGTNEAFGSGWNADTGLPEKDDIYDYLHLLDTDDDGDIDTIDSTLWATKQTADADLTTYAGITPSANAQTLLAETFAQMQASLSIDDLITLSGVAEGSAHLATFTGSTISDNVTVKAALQALETAVEGKQATVTEGSLADSVVVSADIKDGTIAGGDLASNIAITSTGAQDYGGASDFEIPNGAAIAPNVAGEVGIDTTDDQFKYYGGAERVIPYYFGRSATIPLMTTADSCNMSLGSLPYATTITGVACHYGGTSAPALVANITLSYGNGTLMTHNLPTCVNQTTAATWVSVTANNTLAAGDPLFFNITNAATANYTYTIDYKYTVGAQ